MGCRRRLRIVVPAAASRCGVPSLGVCGEYDSHIFFRIGVGHVQGSRGFSRRRGLSRVRRIFASRGISRTRGISRNTDGAGWAHDQPVNLPAQGGAVRWMGTVEVVSGKSGRIDIASSLQPFPSPRPTNGCAEMNRTFRYRPPPHARKAPCARRSPSGDVLLYFRFRQTQTKRPISAEARSARVPGSGTDESRTLSTSHCGPMAEPIALPK
jgi:hypothetical protein